MAQKNPDAAKLDEIQKDLSKIINDVSQIQSKIGSVQAALEELQKSSHMTEQRNEVLCKGNLGRVSSFGIIGIVFSVFGIIVPIITLVFLQFDTTVQAGILALSGLLLLGGVVLLCCASFLKKCELERIIRIEERDAEKERLLTSNAITTEKYHLIMETAEFIKNLGPGKTDPGEFVAQALNALFEQDTDGKLK